MHLLHGLRSASRLNQVMPVLLRRERPRGSAKRTLLAPEYLVPRLRGLLLTVRQSSERRALARLTISFVERELPVRSSRQVSAPARSNALRYFSTALGSLSAATVRARPVRERVNAVQATPSRGTPEGTDRR